MGEAYRPANPDAPEKRQDRLIAAAPEDDLIRLSNRHHGADLPEEMEPLPVHMPPAEPEFQAGDPA